MHQLWLQNMYINPPLGQGKNGRGGGQQILHFFLGDGQVKKFSLPPGPFFPLGEKKIGLTTSPTIVSLLGDLAAPQPFCFPREFRPPDPTSLISLNTSFVAHVFGSVDYLRTCKP